MRPFLVGRAASIRIASIVDRATRDLEAARLPVAQLHQPHDLPIAAIVTLDSKGIAPVARSGRHVVIGEARLHNQRELADLINPCEPPCSDLSIVARGIATGSCDVLQRLIGDFAFIAWNREARTLLAARDALGIFPLYWLAVDRSVIFCSRVRPIVDDQRLSGEYIADFLAAGCGVAGYTSHESIVEVPPGGYVSVDADGRVAVGRYWRAEAFTRRAKSDPDGEAAEFRALLQTAVSSRLTSDGRTWSHLSGGLDSSSIVCVAESLAADGMAPVGLGGTVTFVDTLASADEREFSDLVVEKWQVRNEQIVDYWMWQWDEVGPPDFDQPHLFYPFYARERRMMKVVGDNGGVALLSGHGSDHYLTGSPLLLADLLAHGRIGQLLHQATSWAVANRSSFWKYLYRRAMLPNFPSDLRARFLPRSGRPPDWIMPKFVSRHELSNRTAMAEELAGQRGEKFSHSVLYYLRQVGSQLPRSFLDDEIEVRYPFLDRRLVEFCLTLKPSAIAQPLYSKVPLRLAMRGVLPERIRTRAGKGTLGARFRWSLDRERETVTELVTDPILADYGVVEPIELGRALRRVQEGRSTRYHWLIRFLALETWLRVRSGRWAGRSGLTDNFVVDTLHKHQLERTV